VVAGQRARSGIANLKVSRIALHHDDLSEIIAVFPEGDPVESDCPPHTSPALTNSLPYIG
jgi:hypothetical protein